MPSKDPRIPAKWRLNNRERKRAYDRACHATSERKAANAAQMRRWRKRHPENAVKRNAYMAAYDKKHGERLRAQRAKYWREHPEKHSLHGKLYRKRHPEKVREHCNKWRATKAKAPGSHTLAKWMARVAFYGWRCFYCKLALTIKTLSKDHRIPLSRGGSDFSSNLVPACRHCNSSKGNRWTKSPSQKDSAK